MSAVVPFGFRAQTGEDFEKEVAPMLGSTVRSGYGGRFSHEFTGTVPQRDWLLKNVFYARSFCLVVGDPGSGKSFLSLDLALSMALAVVDPTAPKEWFGRKIKPCGVIYIAAEGQEDFIIRIHAWFRNRGLPATTQVPFYLIPKAVDLRTSSETADKLIAEFADVAAVMRAQWGCEIGITFADTFNRMLAGGDDSKPEHVGALIRNCDMIRAKTGCAVFAVHHTAKNSSSRSPRGHGSITGDNDGEIFVTAAAEGAPNSWTVTRAKGAARGDRFEFRLRPIEIGRDQDQEAVTSCIVAPGGIVASDEAFAMRDAAEAARTGKRSTTADGRYILLTNTLAAMRVLDKLTNEAAKNLDRELPPPSLPVPFGVVAVKQEEWFEALIRAMPGYVEPTEANKAASDKQRDRCRKMRDAAGLKFVDKGLAVMDSGWIWRTTRRVAGIDRPEIDEFAPKSSGPTPEQLGISQDDVDGMF